MVNVPPLGCVPSLMSTYSQSSAGSYDGDGCMKDTNRISKYHNTLLADSVNDLRDTLRSHGATIYLADVYRVYKEVLRLPSDYGMTFTIIYLMSMSILISDFMRKLPSISVTALHPNPLIETHPSLSR